MTLFLRHLTRHTLDDMQLRYLFRISFQLKSFGDYRNYQTIELLHLRDTISSYLYRA